MSKIKLNKLTSTKSLARSISKVESKVISRKDSKVISKKESKLETVAKQLSKTRSLHHRPSLVVQKPIGIAVSCFLTLDF